MELDLGTLNWAAIAPIAALLLALVAYCVVDIVRNDVKFLPKWVWVVLCLASVPLGAVLYLLLGRNPERSA
ncbi:MAG: hypothetical protein CVT64_10980 [Actinobacteria bacterium HGW-Actinobacteria-4]|nr:MAG: hypothetical protein CVT64_10980 [Actinobacteria bacterium HGW-Actinobacteria-4]